MEQFPQQKVYLVVDLPSRPESFKVYCNDEYETPVEGMPKEMPRSATYVGTAEWAWTPMNSRLDAYFISTNRQRSHWILWKVWIDDDDLILLRHIIDYAQINNLIKNNAI